MITLDAQPVWAIVVFPPVWKVSCSPLPEGSYCWQPACLQTRPLIIIYLFISTRMGQCCTVSISISITAMAIDRMRLSY